MEPYETEMVTLELYDGRKVEGQIYTLKEKKEDNVPSKRYLNLILTGAREAELDAAYIERLSQHPTYTPSQEIIDKCAQVPAPDNLPKISVQQLRELGDVDVKEENKGKHTAILGYVFKTPGLESVRMMPKHVGNDITMRNLNWLRGNDTEKLDTFGKPPYPDVS